MTHSTDVNDVVRRMMVRMYFFAGVCFIVGVALGVIGSNLETPVHAESGVEVLWLEASGSIRVRIEPADPKVIAEFKDHIGKFRGASVRGISAAEAKKF